MNDIIKTFNDTFLEKVTDKNMKTIIDDFAVPILKEPAVKNLYKSAMQSVIPAVDASKKATKRTKRIRRNKV